MNIKKILFLMAFGSLLFTSCQKEGLTSTGKEIVEVRAADDFSRIQLWDNIDLQLTQDTFNQIQIIAGENIIGNIETNVQDGTLKISNQNRYNWLRSYNKSIRVVLHLKDIYEIEFHGTGEISCTNVLKTDSLMLNVWDAAGKVDLNIKTKKSSIRYHIGTADIFYRGKTRLSYISSNSYGPVDARDLESEQTYISSIGSNNNYVWATDILEASIGSIGNIYYRDDPNILRTFIVGSGEVKKIQP